MPAKPNLYPTAFPELENRHHKAPERRLLEAILWRAVSDSLAGTPSDHLSQCDIQDAQAWLFERGGAYPFSFLWVCEALDKCPFRIRRAVKDLMRNGTSGGYRRADRKVPVPISVS
jgi:hypothetical protein